MRGRITALLLAACFLPILSGCADKTELKLGTGNTGGSYYAHGMALSESMENTGTALRVRETAGSVSNIRLITEGYIDLAYVQSDVLNDAANGTGMFKTPHSGYSAIAGLYTEACQLVAAADSGINTVSDLYGKRVSLGEEESGVMQNAVQIMSAYGISEDTVKPRYLSFTDSAEALKNDEIDAFFCTAGVPTNAVSELAETEAIKLIPIDDAIADRIIDQYDGYTKYTVEAGTYKGQNEPVNVLGIKTVLIASDSVSADAVKMITERLFDVESGLDTSYATEDIPIQFHEGAAEYYKENGISVSTDGEASEK